MVREKDTNYKAIVIGTGQAGKPLSITLAQAGWKTAIIEKEHVGGTCVNVGCTPTKTMVASARVAYLNRRAVDYGVITQPVEVDMRTVLKRKSDIVHSFTTGSRKRLENTEGLDLIMGEARFTSSKSVEVHLETGDSRSLTSDYIFINVGCRPAKPPIPGLDKVSYLDSTTIMELDIVPPHLLVLGGGYIGIEFGQMFRRFGSEVTIVQRGKQLLAREDSDVAEEIATILRDDGVEVLLDTEAVHVEGDQDGVQLKVKSPEGRRSVSGSHLLVAAGRVPNSDSLNLKEAGIESDSRGFIKVNNQLESTQKGVYALGDVKGGPMFTHISYDDFRIIRTNLIEGGNTTTDGRLVPYAVFMDPELGRVGSNEQEARNQGYNIRVGKLPMTGMARAIETDETRGFMKAIVDADTDQILGCAVLGVEGGELMSMIEVAMMGKLPYTALKEGIFAHPTRAEALNNLFMAMDAS